MIDVKTHARMHDSNAMKDQVIRPFRHSISDTAEYDTWPLKVTATGIFTDEIALMLPKTIEAFEVEAKKWGVFLVVTCPKTMRLTLLSNFERFTDRTRDLE
jgi:hypothetical protein